MKGKSADSRPIDKDDAVIPEMITLTHDIDGNPFLEGTAPTVVREIWEKGVDYEKAKTERTKVQKKETDAKAELPALYTKYPEMFIADENNPKILTYAVGGLVVEVERTETFVVKTHKESPAPPISNDALADAEKLKRGGTNGGKKKEKTPADIY